MIKYTKLPHCIYFKISIVSPLWLVNLPLSNTLNSFDVCSIFSLAIYRFLISIWISVSIQDINPHLHHSWAEHLICPNGKGFPVGSLFGWGTVARGRISHGFWVFEMLRFEVCHITNMVRIIDAHVFSKYHTRPYIITILNQICFWRKWPHMEWISLWL